LVYWLNLKINQLVEISWYEVACTSFFVGNISLHVEFSLKDICWASFKRRLCRCADGQTIKCLEVGFDLISTRSL